MAFFMNSTITAVRSSPLSTPFKGEYSPLGSNEAMAFHSNLSMFLYGTDRHRVPMGIRSVRIDFGVKILQPGTVCYFDNLTLTVHQC